MKKPNIDEVCQVFHRFQQAMIKVMIRAGSFTETKEQADNARIALKEDLVEIGLADHIDWTEEE